MTVTRALDFSGLMPYNLINPNKPLMTTKTEITIEGDSIIYNGVKYEKVKRPLSEQPFKLQYALADKLESLVNEMYTTYDDICCNVDIITHELLEEMSQHIPDYSDWVEVLKGFPNQTLPQEKSDLLRLGWNCYCKKMWDMISE